MTPFYYGPVAEGGAAHGPRHRRELPLAPQVRLGEINYLIELATDDRLEHVQRKPFRHLQGDGGWHRELRSVHHCVDEDRAVAAFMHSCWVSFAKVGKPQCAIGGRAWPAYNPQTDELLEFNSPSAIKAHYRKPQLDAQQAAETVTTAK